MQATGVSEDKTYTYTGSRKWGCADCGHTFFTLYGQVAKYKVPTCPMCGDFHTERQPAPATLPLPSAE